MLQSRVSVDSATTYVLDDEGQVWYSENRVAADNNKFTVPMKLEGIPAPIQTMRDVYGHFAGCFIDIEGNIWSTCYDTNFLEKVRIPRMLPCLTQIKDVAASHFCSAFLNNNGELWLDREYYIQFSPTCTPFVPPQLSGVQVKSIKASSYRMVFLDVDGCVWMIQDVDEEKLAFYEHTCKIVDIHAGYRKIVIQDEEGFVWQRGRNGSFGLGNIAQLPGFHKMHNEPIKMVSVSENHAIMLDYDDQVWTSSYYEHMQIGEKTHFQKSVRLLNIPGIQMVSAGFSHNLLLDHSGIVWVYGKNQAGQLGFGDLKERKHCTKIRSLPPIQSVMASFKYNQCFSMFLDFEGSIWACGEFERGLRRVKSEKICFPKIVLFHKQKNVKSAKEVTIS